MTEGAVLIPWEELPAAVRHYVWANAPHVLDVPCRYSLLKDGSLLIEPMEGETGE